MAKTGTRTAKKLIYGVHPGVLLAQKWIAELKQKTGRSLGEWLKVIKQEAPATENERRDWLKSKFSLGTNSAWWLAERSLGKGEELGDPNHYLRPAEQYAEETFSAQHAVLRPISGPLLPLGL